MNIKTILLISTLAFTTLPGVSKATTCNEAMQLVQIELNNLNAAQASGNLKAVEMAMRAYFLAVEGANTVCTSTWLGDN